MKGLLNCMGKRSRTGEERSRTERLYEGLVELYGETKQNGRETKRKRIMNSLAFLAKALFVESGGVLLVVSGYRRTDRQMDGRMGTTSNLRGFLKEFAGEHRERSRTERFLP